MGLIIMVSTIPFLWLVTITYPNILARDLRFGLLFLMIMLGLNTIAIFSLRTLKRKIAYAIQVLYGLVAIAFFFFLLFDLLGIQSMKIPKDLAYWVVYTINIGNLFIFGYELYQSQQSNS